MQEELITHLANIIHYHRQQSGLSRVELAELAGVGKTVVYDIEHGKKSIQLSSLLPILNALNIKIELQSPLMQQFKENENAQS